MADINKRFRIGNTTVNLGKVENAMCRFNTEPIFCKVYKTGFDPCRFYMTVDPCRIYMTACPMMSDIPTACKYGSKPIEITPDIWEMMEITPQYLTPQLELEDIVGLKEQLKMDMKALEEHEMALRKLEKPQTLEEIDAIEDKLVNSLAEVQKLKEELSKNN